MFIKVRISGNQVRAINVLHIVSISSLNESVTEIKTSDKLLTDVFANVDEVLTAICEAGENPASCASLKVIG